MSFLEQILLWEKDLFLMVNGSDSPLLDSIMWLFSGALMWIPIGVFFLYCIAYKKSCSEWLPVLLAIGFVILFCDQFSSHLCKPYFERFRPTHHPLFMDQVDTLFGYRGGKYGFISGHATNFFGFAMLTSCIFKNKVYSTVIFIWATLVAYSRVYLGVHFISDIVAGAISGMIIGYLVYKLYIVTIKHCSKRFAKPVTKADASGRNIAIGLVFNSVFFFSFSQYIVYLLKN